MKNCLFFNIAVPVLMIGTVFSFCLVFILGPPIKDTLKERFDAVLVHASDLALIICEERMTDMIEHRFSDNTHLVNVYKKETLEQIKAIERKFPEIKMAVCDAAGQIILSGSASASFSDGVDMSIYETETSLPVPLNFSGREVMGHWRYFPFWQWTIVSFMYTADYLAPVSKGWRLVSLGTFGAFLLSFVTILILFYRRINRPLKQILAATQAISKGEVPRIQVIGNDEIGQVGHSVMVMAKKLAMDRERIRSTMVELTEYKLAVESSHDLIYAVYPDYRYAFVNRTFLDYHGLERSRAVDHKLEDILDQTVFKSVIKPKLRQSMAGSTVTFEMTYPYEAMGKRQLLVAYSPITDSEGRTSGVVAVVKDVSEQQKTERELIKYQEHLEQMVEKRTAELKRIVNTMSGREIRMIQLKKENIKLKEALAREREVAGKETTNCDRPQTGKGEIKE